MIVVIPARGGSKRLPHKNIQLLNGRPLLRHTLDVVTAAALGCPVYVSTDDPAIADVAKQVSGVDVVDRPSELAADAASTESVLVHVLDQLPASVVTPTWVMTLPPTAPFRAADTIRQFADSAGTLARDCDCLMSITENRGDFWLQQKDGSLARLFPDAPRRQQERTPMFEENSAIYLTRVRALRETGSILGRRVRGIAVPAIEGFDINTPEDLQVAECIAQTLGAGVGPR